MTARETWLSSLDEAAATVDEFGEPASPLLPEPEDEEDSPRECSHCGSTETIELTDDGPPEQSINVCAGCGSDEA